MEDVLLSMAKDQGYVPKECDLKGEIVMALMAGGEFPCKRCNMHCKHAGKISKAEIYKEKIKQVSGLR